MAPSPATHPMRAAVIDDVGPASNIHTGWLAVPAHGRDEVPVAVQAVAVNHVDTFVRSGAYPTAMEFPFVVGRDLVGIVTEDACGFARGEAVWCNSMGHHGRQGAAAEHVAVPWQRVYRLPDGVGVDTAAAVVHPAATAHLALYRHARLERGETVFIGGGAGHVGSAALVMAAQTSRRVITSARGDDTNYCLSLGAGAVLDYRDDQFDARMHAAAPEGIDVYLETSGHHDLALATSVLAPRGRIVLMSGMQAAPQLPAGALYTNDGSILGFAISNATVEELAEAARGVNALLTGGLIAPRNIEVFDLEGAAEAHERLERGRTRGTRLVLHP